jgi:hypothetical protein
VLNRLDNAYKHNLHLPSERIDKRGPAAAIRHVHQVDAAQHPE